MKLGGINQRIDFVQETEFMRQQPTMIMGITLTHQMGRPSIMTVCASVDRYAATYISDIALVRPIENRGPREHIEVEVLVPAMKNMLRGYLKRNGTRPRSVIIYRDGVSDGQLANSLNREVTALKMYHHY